VITYILGIGDRYGAKHDLVKVFENFFQFAVNCDDGLILICRHLDNLLLTDDGRLFHVDFAFILGRDPKPFPPPMKLCKEMVEAMGGAERYLKMI